MVGKAYPVVGGLLVGLLGGMICGVAWSQDAPAPAEQIPAPAPAETTPQYQPEATYGPREASRDAAAMAEEQRRWAVDRQLQVLDDVRWYNTWGPYVHRYALPYIYAYAPRRAAVRAHRAIDRAGGAPVYTPWPQVPGDVYGYPYYPLTKQPLGHEKIRTGPNSYIYRPRYAPQEAQPTPAEPQTPTLAPPRTAPQPPVAESPAEPPPAVEQPRLPVPEAIPVPPAESGPREF